MLATAAVRDASERFDRVRPEHLRAVAVVDRGEGADCADGVGAGVDPDDASVCSHDAVDVARDVESCGHAGLEPRHRVDGLLVVEREEKLGLLLLGESGVDVGADLLPRPVDLTTGACRVLPFDDVQGAVVSSADVRHLRFGVVPFGNDLRRPAGALLALRGGVDAEVVEGDGLDLGLGEVGTLAHEWYSLIVLTALERALMDSVRESTHSRASSWPMSSGCTSRML